jgi:hypothetical protein
VAFLVAAAFAVMSIAFAMLIRDADAAQTIPGRARKQAGEADAPQAAAEGQPAPLLSE